MYALITYLEKLWIWTRTFNNAYYQMYALITYLEKL